MRCRNLKNERHGEREQHLAAEVNMKGHPCFGGDTARYGRIHLPVAPRCNIKCRYCTRKHDCVNESRPGLASAILDPGEALQRVVSIKENAAIGPLITVVGIAGPGDPLANPETFETLRLIKNYDPRLITCLSTNGLLLAEKMEQLQALGLVSLTVTINAVDPDVGEKIYEYISYHGRRYGGAEAAAILIENQFQGIRRAAEGGMVVKVNTVLIPGINDNQVSLVAERSKKMGASIMNIMPLIPQAEFAHVSTPSREDIESVRERSERVITQMRHCRQCRADATGLIGL